MKRRSANWTTQPPESARRTRASEGYAARVLLDFARFPVARVRRADSGGWVVQFADLRFTEPGSRARPGGFALNVPVGP